MVRRKLIGSSSLITLLLAASLLIFLGSFPAMAKTRQSSVEGRMMMKTGGDKMVEGKNMILQGLKEEGFSEDPAIKNGFGMLEQGEKMILEGKAMFGPEGSQTKGKELMMAGGTKMMEGKDIIMRELTKMEAIKQGELQVGESKVNLISPSVVRRGS
jgi:hypothetical protein